MNTTPALLPDARLALARLFELVDVLLEPMPRGCVWTLPHLAMSCSCERCQALAELRVLRARMRR